MCDVIRVNSRWVIRDNMKGLRQDDRLIGFLGETAAGRLSFHPNYGFLHDCHEQYPRCGRRHSREGIKGVKKMLRPVRTYGRHGNLFSIFQGIALLHCGQLKARFTPSQLDMIKPGPGLSAHPRLARISAGLNDRSSLIKLLECEDRDASLGQSRSLLLLFWEPECER